MRGYPSAYSRAVSGICSSIQGGNEEQPVSMPVSILELLAISATELLTQNLVIRKSSSVVRVH